MFTPREMPARFYRFPLQTIFVVLLVGFGVRANATTVGCSGAPSGTYDFPTLTAAIAGAPLSNNSITIFGTCTEEVVITGAQNLTISGAPGAVLADSGAGNPVLDFESSQNVSLQTIKIQMNSYPFYGPVSGILVNNSGLSITSIDIEGAAGTDGIDINPNSNLLMLGTNLIENNNDGQGNGEGINMTGPAASLQIGTQARASSCTTIQGNGDDGIVADIQSSVTIRTFPTTCATIQNNGAFGVQVLRNSIGILSNHGNSPSITLSGNVAGAAATEYGLLFLNGPMLIQNNSAAGVFLRDASANMASANGTLLGPTIQQNGSNLNPSCCVVPGGISADSSSNLFLQAGLVTNNLAPGIVIDDNSSMETSQANTVTVTQNPIGISVGHDSSLELSAAPSVTGNANADVVCSGFSTAHGDASGVGKMRCDTFIPGPGRHPGNGHQGMAF